VPGGRAEVRKGEKGTRGPGRVGARKYEDGLLGEQGGIAGRF